MFASVASAWGAVTTLLARGRGIEPCPGYRSLAMHRHCIGSKCHVLITVFALAPRPWGSVPAFAALPAPGGHGAGRRHRTMPRFSAAHPHIAARDCFRASKHGAQPPFPWPHPTEIISHISPQAGKIFAVRGHRAATVAGPSPATLLAAHYSRWQSTMAHVRSKRRSMRAIEGGGGHIGYKGHPG